LTAAVGILWAAQTSRTIPHWRNEDVLSEYSIHEAPAIPVFHAVRGRVLATERGDFAGAIREYEMALRLGASSTAPWPSVAHDAHMGLANIAKAKGKLDEAAREYELAAAAMPANSFAYKELASLYVRQDNFLKGADYLSQAVKLDPRDLEARFNLGVCWLKLGKYREAAAEFDAVAEVNPDFPHLWDAQAQALLHGGDY
jgi:tetratricopeptide (TPR) repeat protein